MGNGRWRGPRVARVTTVTGSAALLCSLWAQGPMWLVELGLESVAPGGGEYLVALFLGLPALLLALALLGIAMGRRCGASRATRIAFGIAVGSALGWVGLLLGA